MKVKPNYYEIIEFKEGLLRILGEEEEKIHNLKSGLEYGKPKTGVEVVSHPYLVYLEDLKKLKQYIFPWRFKRINEFTMARRTLTLGLQVMRTSHEQKTFSDTATFSRKEYKIIKQYL
ncbi:MAG: hypothetical protein QW404_00610 [Candidatus Nanoarchaeia archaeon]